MKNNKRLSFSARAELCHNTISRNLFLLIEQKQTNLALSADVTKCDALLELADQCGPHICVLKTHIDILEDFKQDALQRLIKISQQHRFLILEDRKFADIGKTVQQQYQGGIYQIADWADLITVHSLPGPGCLSALQEVGLQKNRGVLLLAEMSSAGNLAGNEYSKATVSMAKDFPEFVIGFIAQHQISSDPRHIHFTPGVQLMNKNDSMGQQYNHPEFVIGEQGSDVIIVGRGIISADSPATTAKHYREISWYAYQKALQS